MTTTITPTCYGKLFEADNKDCQACQMNVECHAAITAPTAIAAPTPELDIETEAEIATQEVEEAAAKVAAAQELAAADQPKLKKKASPKAPKDTAPKKTDAPKGATKARTALKTAAFIKDENDKLVLLADPTTVKEPDLIINAGDIVRINNPRSKFNGQDFVISCYSEKYECFRGTQPATKVNADFLPHQIEVIQRAATT